MLRRSPPRTKATEDGLESVVPNAIDASHKLVGYGPELSVDGNAKTFWLVPGGQRMEMMSYAHTHTALNMISELSCLIHRPLLSTDVISGSLLTWERAGNLVR